MELIKNAQPAMIVANRHATQKKHWGVPKYVHLSLCVHVKTASADSVTNLLQRRHAPLQCVLASPLSL